MNFFGNFNGNGGNQAEGETEERALRYNNGHMGGEFITLQEARRDLIGEIQAIMEYDDHIHRTTDKVARETWEDIIHEEMVHVGELLALLDYLDTTQKQYVASGIDEFNQRISNQNLL